MARLWNILRSTKLVQPIYCLVNVLITSRTSRNVSLSFKLETGNDFRATIEVNELS
jgi:hypothetical protein